MKCKNCGREIGKKKFCGYCGQENTRNSKLIVVLILLALFVIGCVIGLCFVLPKFNIDNYPDIDGNVEYINADEYFNQHAEVVSVIDAKNSKDVTTEKETYQILSDRGFGDYLITTTYDMEGKYLSEYMIDGTSNDKHPMYSTYYGTESGEMWIISVVNNSITASPVVYNQDSTEQAETLIVEEDTIMSYDGPLNKFYEIVPNESLAILKKVERIDAQTLDNLTAEEIDKL